MFASCSHVARLDLLSVSRFNLRGVRLRQPRCRVLAGNHDLDFGLEEFRELMVENNFPWLCSNAWDRNKSKPLGGCKEYFVIDKSNDGGPKILTVGLVEQGWLDTLSSIEPEDVIFEAPVDFAKRRVPELVAQLGPFDAVVAVTHMRMPNDRALAAAAREVGIDVILGGHDHNYADEVVDGVRILNSGSDFKMFSVVDVEGRIDGGGGG